MVKQKERNRSYLTCFGWYWSVLSAGREPLYCISLCCTWFSQKTVFKFPSLVAVQRSDMRSGDLSGAAPTGPRGRRVSWVWQLLLTQLLLTVRTAATLPLTGESSSSSSSDDDDNDDDDDEICTFLSVLRVTVRLRAPPTASRHKVCCVKNKKPQKNNQAILHSHTVVLLLDDY